VINILYFSAAIFAIAFFVLVIFLSKTLMSLQKTLDSVASTLTKLEKQVEGITRETTDLLHKTNLLADDIQEKTKKLNTVVDAVQEVGHSIQQFNSSVQKVSATLSNKVDEGENKLSQAVQWGKAVMEIIDRIKEYKKK